MSPANRKAVPTDERLMEEITLTENARKVLEARYLKKNEAGQCVEEPARLFRRVAGTIADVEMAYGGSTAERQAWEDRFYELMTSGRFMPNSPTLMNAGRDMGMLSACFVLPVRDSIVDIFDSIKHTALIQKAGGGTGFAFDELRPTGDFIQSSGGTTSGPISFWRAFSEATDAIQQGAFRRGANMGMMYIHHPDILKFLHAKQDLKQFTNYNISVKITDTWIRELQADPDSPQVVRNPRNGKAYVIPRDADIWQYNMRDLIEVDCVEAVSPVHQERYYTTPRLTGPLPADLAGNVYTKREIWETIVQNAWQTGEPGVVFIDRINEHNPTPHLGRIEATNPCGEQPLLPYEACNLGSINLGLFVRNAGTPGADVDWQALRETVHLSTRFLDNVIDANNYPLPEISAICKANRKIGLGIMGFADALFMLGVAYDSEEGVAWGQRFMQFVNDEAHDYSELLARQRGCFPNWDGSIWQTKHSRLMRNAAVTTVAPTGTISIIANCSSGVEPLFSLAFIRNVLRGQKQGETPLVEVNDTFRQVAAKRGLLSDELLERLASEGTLARIDGVPEDIRRVFVCAHDITPDWHIRMQAAFQQHCDSSISKTINFPRHATPEEVDAIYHRAFKLGCKGVTVYRDGCRECQPMALKESDEATLRRNSGRAPRRSDGADETVVQEFAKTSEKPTDQERPAPPVSDKTTVDLVDSTADSRNLQSAIPNPRSIEPMDLPEIVSGFRIRQMTAFGNMHVKITVAPRTERELEIFAQLGKGGDVANSDLEGICRTASLWLRAGGSLRHLIKQWEGIGSSLQIPTRTGRVMSLPDGLACALKKYTRAKERFGLRALLLGEVCPRELDNPHPAPHDRSAAAVDRPLTAAARSGTAPSPDTPGGNGGSPAARAQPGAGPALTAPVERRSGGTSRLGEAFERETKAQSAVSEACAGDNGNGHGNDVDTGFTAVETATAVAELNEPETAVASVEVSIDTDVSEQVESVTRSAGRQVPAGLSEVMAAVRHHHDAASHYILRCPQCGGMLAQQEGCLRCANHCGWAAC